jgi:cell pole-organizing protein PopZ
MSKAINDIVAERRRQIEAEGWTPEHDDAHDDGEMAHAAACYANHSADQIRDHVCPPGDPPMDWPWDDESWRPSTRRRDLVKAAALIVAEIERLDRAELAERT